MNFIKANDKFVNLETVSSINFLGKRVAFDLNTPVELDNGKVITYYAYADFNSQDESDFFKNSLLKREYIKENFISTNNGLINLNHVCAVKFETTHNGFRIIFNLSHSITSIGFNNQSRLTSKFIYVDFKNEKEFEEYKQNITKKLGV